MPHSGKAIPRSRKRRYVDPFLSPENRTSKDTSKSEETSRSDGKVPIPSKVEQVRHSPHRWNLWSPNTIALLGIATTIIIALLFGIASWIFQSKGDERAEEDSEATAEGNRLAAEGNRLAAESNRLAAQGYRLAVYQLCKTDVSRTRTEVV
jgi:hypothetical protein